MAGTGWRIYYVGGATYSDRDGAVEDAPGLGVLVIGQADPDVGRELRYGSDFYIWEADRWLAVDQYGLWDYLARPGWRKVVAGRTVAPRDMARAYAAAFADPDLPPKTARLTGEDAPWPPPSA